MLKIDFIGIGVVRSATTWLHACLEEHPDICVSEPKETGFFRREDLYSKNIEAYAQYFSHCQEDKIKGEYDPKYLTTKGVAKRIYEAFPKIKLIMVLRDPKEVVHSYYLLRDNRGRPVGGSFSEVIRREDNIFTRQGMYGSCIEEYLKYFPKEQLFIGFYDDVKNNPKKFLKELFTFLEVDDSFVPKQAIQKVNYSGLKQTKYKKLNKLLYSIDEYIYRSKFLRVLMPIGKRFRLNTIKSKLINAAKEKNIRKVPAKQYSKPTLKQEDEEYLNELFKKEIEKVEATTGRNLKKWYEQ